MYQTWREGDAYVTSVHDERLGRRGFWCVGCRVYWSREEMLSHLAVAHPGSAVAVARLRAEMVPSRVTMTPTLDGRRA